MAKDIQRLSGNNHRRNITGLPQFIITIKRLNQSASELFGGFIQKACLLAKSLEDLILPKDKFFTRSNQLKKDLAYSKMTNNKIVIRQANKDDEPFLFSTYLKHNWYDKRNTTLLPKLVWMGAQRRRLKKIFNDNKIKMACLSDDPDIIIGYGFIDKDEKPFVYVKMAWRDCPYKIEDLLSTTLKGNNNEKT